VFKKIINILKRNLGVKKIKRIVFIFGVLFIILVLLFITNIQSGIFTKKEKTSSSTNQQVEQSCTRTKPFSLEPEFNKALDLLDQRSGREEHFDAKTGASRGMYSRYFPALDDRNCLNIFYSDNIPNIGDTAALFDSDNSTPNDIIIKVNKTYLNKDTDVLVMAMILAHELTHVDQLDYDEYYGIKTSCLDKETGAFIMQLKFLALLKPEEKSRLVELMKGDSVLGTVRDLWIEQDKASVTCDDLKIKDNLDQNGYNDCFWKQMETVTKDYVQGLPGYQKHCEL
jgi:hypothetical protein